MPASKAAKITNAVEAPVTVQDQQCISDRDLRDCFKAQEYATAVLQATLEEYQTGVPISADSEWELELRKRLEVVRKDSIQPQTTEARKRSVALNSLFQQVLESGNEDMQAIALSGLRLAIGTFQVKDDYDRQWLVSLSKYVKTVTAVLALHRCD